MKNWIKKKLGWRHTHECGEIDFSWGYFKRFKKPKNWRVAFKVYAYDDSSSYKLEFSPLFFTLVVKVAKREVPKDCWSSKSSEMYGFYIYDWYDVVLGWGNKSHWWGIPYRRCDHFKTELLDHNFNVIMEQGRGARDEWHDAKEKSQVSYPYTYTRENGEVQNRTAAVSVERITWKRKWWPFANLVRTSIWVEFDKEVGEGINTWKGGTVGCGNDLLPNESVEECLRRMERERKFKR